MALYNKRERERKKRQKTPINGNYKKKKKIRLELLPHFKEMYASRLAIYITQGPSEYYRYAKEEHIFKIDQIYWLKEAMEGVWSVDFSRRATDFVRDVITPSAVCAIFNTRQQQQQQGPVRFFFR